MSVIYVAAPVLNDQPRGLKAPLVSFGGASSESDWPCQNCGKLNYPSFNLCWHCQHRRHKKSRDFIAQTLLHI